MLLAGKVVLVTGGARGLGVNISNVLAREGAKVAVNYSASREKSEKVVQDIRAAGGEAEAFQADVRDYEQVQNMTSEIMARFSRLDGVVNNAIGGKQNGPFDEATAADFANSFDFGCQAVVNTIQAARPIMKEQGGGRIVNIVTEIWNMAPAGWSIYMAGKGAMVGLSRSLAVELGPENITVNMVAPGWMADEKVDTSSEGSIAFAKTIPLRVHGSADEIGNGCVFFLSGLASYVTGAYLSVTGGRITQAGM